MIPVRRHLEYASGYLALGLVKPAAAELARIQGDPAQSPPVWRLRLDLYHQTRQWTKLAQVAEKLAHAEPKEEQAWISWAFALRELERVAEAESVLHRAQPLHGTSSAVLHYNLACYACLLGKRDEAWRQLITACKLDPEFKLNALDDPDLASMRNEIAAWT